MIDMLLYIREFGGTKYATLDSVEKLIRSKQDAIDELKKELEEYKQNELENQYMAQWPKQQ